MTHRDRARNAASSRAIPFPAMTERIQLDPVIPLMWGMEQQGMQTGDNIPEYMRDLAEQIWRKAMADAIEHATALHNIGQTYAEHCGSLARPEDIDVKIHKSIPNRIVEPWMWITVVMSATEWANFFRLRCHSDAEIHFQKIAGMIREALEKSEPRKFAEGMWHLPFIQDDELPENTSLRREMPIEHYQKISVARCARVSYLTHEGKRDHSKDLELFERLVQGSGFGHWSAHEHVAEAVSDRYHRSGPFVGWKQFRKSFPLENAAG